MSYSYPNRPPKPVVERVVVKPCCAKCRRGIKGFGELPCGYPDTCPNETCAHSELGAHTKAVAFLAKRAEIREER